MQSWINVAQVIRLKSRGEGFVVRCAAGLSSYLRSGMTVHVVPPRLDAPRHFLLSGIQLLEGSDAVLSVKGMPSEQVAGTLVGCSFIVDLQEFPEGFLNGEDDFQGWDVTDEELGTLGQVTDFIEGPAQSLLEVTTPEGKPFLIPYVDEFILEVDEEAGTILTKIPAGLLTLGD